MSQPRRKVIPFDLPARYQIHVQGRIDPDYSDVLGGLRIYQSTALETGPPVTGLEGELCDQAALAGVLNILYEMHLTVLMVKRMENSEVAECDSRKTDAA
jgi:hypothetical protein